MTGHLPQERPLGALDVIFSRRSIRAYAPDRLDEATVRSLLDAAVQAPTAVHEEAWAFVVVQDRDVLKRYSDRAKVMWKAAAPPPADARPEASHFAARMLDPEFNLFYDAGTLIVICAKPKGPFVTADCWLAAATLMLAACALGLGSCVIGSSLPVLSALEAKADLGIPADVTPIVPIILGVPREMPPAAARKDPEILCWRR